MADRPTVAAAMIVRDEERFLDGCLNSLRDRVDEIVIADTGSRDASIDIATRAGARVIHHRWADDFAAARNAALSATSSDWILYIDADERLNLPRGGHVADYIDPNAIACFVRFRPKTGYTRYREWRLFRNDRRLRFTGAIHETIVPTLRAISASDHLPIVQSTIEIDHYGYDGDQTHKHGRNLALLRRAVRDDPDRAYCWHHLTETLAALGQDAEAEAAAHQGLASAERRDQPEQRAAASLIRHYLARTRIAHGERPLDLIEQGLIRMPDDHALNFLRGRTLLDLDRPNEALEIANALTALDADTLTDGPLAFDRRIFEDMACELAALACLRLGHQQDAAEHFAKAARFAPHHLIYRAKAAALRQAVVPACQ